VNKATNKILMFMWVDNLLVVGDITNDFEESVQFVHNAHGTNQRSSVEADPLTLYEHLTLYDTLFQTMSIQNTGALYWGWRSSHHPRNMHAQSTSAQPTHIATTSQTSHSTQYPHTHTYPELCTALLTALAAPN
jgi:hypothetical protein